MKIDDAMLKIKRMLCTPLIMTTMSVSAATIYVDDDYAGQIGDGTSASPFGTLQEAAAAAITKDTISVADGTYLGDVDFGSKIITNDIPYGTAIVSGNLSASGEFNRSGLGRLELNGGASIGCLNIRDGATIVVSPEAASGTTNTLALNGLNIYANKSLIISNAITTLDMGSTLFSTEHGSTLAFVGGKFTSTTASFAPGGGGNDSTANAKLIFDGVDATLDMGAADGFRMGNKSPAAVIVTNNANVTMTKAFFGSRGSMHQYSGKVEIKGGGTDALAIGYNYQNGNQIAFEYYLHGGVFDKTAVNDNRATIGGHYGQAAKARGNFYIYGGDAYIRCKYCYIGVGEKEVGQTGGLYVRGGSFNLPRATGSELSVGYKGDGEFEVSNGGIATVNGTVTALSKSAGGRTAAVNILTNGTLKARNLVSNANMNGTGDSATLLLDGGSVVANTLAEAAFMYGFTDAAIGVGGVIVDTAGQDLTIAQSFSARPGQPKPTASTAAELAALPAFTKIGAGTLTLSGNNDWPCATCVSNGTLAVGEDSLPATTTLQLRGGVIDLNGHSITVANLVGSGIVSNGALTVTGTVWPGVGDSGVLKIDSTAILGLATLGCSVAKDGTCGRVEAAGAIDLEGVAIVGEGMENVKDDCRGLTLVQAAAINGKPATTRVGKLTVALSGGDLALCKMGFVILVR